MNNEYYSKEEIDEVVNDAIINNILDPKRNLITIFVLSILCVLFYFM